MTAASSALEPGIIIAGKLRVVRMLGAGGMGAVYEVEHQITKHRRALKMMHRGMALLVPDAVTRFLREASAAGRIGNPHIVETFDAGELPSGEPYIVMEMLKGRSLAELIAQAGALDATLVIDVMLQACDGVQAAHDAGIVHRDLKPDNLFLVDGPAPLLKILDFGISKFDPDRTGDARVTAEGATLGTPSYMAPEQLGGDGQIDGRTDVYALGVVLYECLTATTPYSASSLPELALRIYEGHYASLRTLRPELPAELEAIVSRAMSRDKAQRYQSVRELGAALDALARKIPRSGVRSVVSHEALSATQLTPGERPRTSLPAPRSRPGWHWLVVAIGLGLAVALALVVGQARKTASTGAAPSQIVPTDVTRAVQAAQPAGATASRVFVPSVPPPTAAPVAEPIATQPAAMPPTAARGTAPLAAEQHAPPGAPADAQHKAHGRSGSTTRAREHGLLEDNPF